MANDAKKKSSLLIFCLTNVRYLLVFLEVHGRDIAFAKSEQSYHLTSTDTEVVAVRLLLPFHRKKHIPESYSIVCIHVYVKCIKPIFNHVFDPMTLTCCFCF